MAKRDVTYREVLQRMIKQLQDVYDEAGSLRDASGYGKFEGKDEMNFVRGKLYDLWPVLKRLDNGMTDDWAKAKVWKEEIHE